MCQIIYFLYQIKKNYQKIIQQYNEFNEDITQNEYYIFKLYNNKKSDPFKLLLFSSDEITWKRT